MSPGTGRVGGRIDWDAVHDQLARAAKVEADRDSPERARAVLADRARSVARVPARTPAVAEVFEVATFVLEGERYAIATRYVRRITRTPHVTPVPGTTAILAGVTNSEGEVLAVFDLRVLFGHAQGSASSGSRMIVLGEAREELAFLTGEAQEVLILRYDELLAPPGLLDGAGRSLLLGVTEAALIVIDGAALLRDERLVINQVEDAGT